MPVLNATANPGIASWSADGDGMVLGSGGNARGTAAVDLQTARAAATQVASGNYSVIPGGRNNTASGAYSFAAGYNSVAAGFASIAIGGGNQVEAGFSNYNAVLGGQNNRIQDANYYCLVAGGNDSYIADGSYMYGAVILGGSTNTIGAPGVGDGTYSAILAGAFNLLSNSGYDAYNSAMVAANSSDMCFGGSASECAIIASRSAEMCKAGNATLSAILGGNNADMTGSYNVILGGNNNSITGDGSVAAGGSNVAVSADSAVGAGGSCTVDHPASLTIGAGDSIGANAQSEFVSQGHVTTTATTTTLQSLALEGLAIPANTAFSVYVHVVAWNTTDKTSSAWFLTGLLQRDASNNTTLVGQAGNGTAAAATGAITNDAASATLAVNLAADDTAEALDINVTSVAKTIRWTATVSVARSSG